MSRTTVSLDDAQTEWVEDQAAELEISKSKVVRECVDAARGEQSMFGGVHTGQTAETDGRLASLESRIDALESDARSRLQFLESTLAERGGGSGGNAVDTEDDAVDSTGLGAAEVENTVGEASELTVQSENPLSNATEQSSDLEVPDTANRDTLESHLRSSFDPDIAEAVLACWDLLQQRGTMKESEFRKQYEQFPAGYSSGSAWWNDGITPVLDELPGVKPPAEGGSFYQFRY